MCTSAAARARATSSARLEHVVEADDEDHHDPDRDAAGQRVPRDVAAEEAAVELLPPRPKVVLRRLGVEPAVVAHLCKREQTSRLASELARAGARAQRRGCRSLSSTSPVQSMIASAPSCANLCVFRVVARVQ
eukprot:6208751-Pleurochrysis_carterae.AAC.2